MRYLFIFSLLIFTACKKDHAGCFDSAGKERTVSRDLPVFIGIDVNDRFDIELVQDSSIKHRVVISAGQNIITGIKTEIRDSILYIRNENRCHFVRDMQARIKVKLYVDRFTYIAMREAATLKSYDSIRTPHLNISSSSLEDLDLMVKAEFIDARGYNSGAITLRGKAQLVACTIEDVCVLNTRKMAINDLYIFHYGRKHAWINGKRIIGAYIFNTANVYYDVLPDYKLFVEKKSSGDFLQN